MSRLSLVAVSRLQYSMCDTARTTFSYTEMHQRDNVLWRVMTWRKKWNLGLIPQFLPVNL